MDEICHIARLPAELLVSILRLVLPNMHYMIDKEQCQEYITHLYALRSVSK